MNLPRVWTWKGSSRWCRCHCKEQVEKDNCKRRQRRFLCRGTEEKLSGRRPKCSGKDDVDKIKKSCSYINAVAKKGIASCHEIVITRGKTKLKKRSGELVYKTFTRRVSLAIPVSTTPSRPVFVPATPGSTSTVADEIPATLTIINSFSTPPAAQAYSYRELLDNQRLYDDLIWVVLRVQT